MDKSNNELTAIILTFNEELHVERAICSLKLVANRILVIDSGSTDATTLIAKENGAEVYYNSWVNHAVQINWALDNCNIDTRWVLRLDADEYLTKELQSELLSVLGQSDFTHYYIKRRVIFMDHWIRYGGYYPTWLLRLWEHNINARCENRWMDEHIKVEGGVPGRLKSDLVDHNLNDLTWWTDKHNRYATREAVDILNTLYGFTKDNDYVTPKLFGSQVERKRWFKMRYVKLPLFIRPLLYFFYRYLVKFGFLDKKAGLIWHCLQGGWYRFLVDAKIAEAYSRAGKNRSNLEQFIVQEWGVQLEN